MNWKILYNTKQKGPLDLRQDGTTKVRKIANISWIIRK